jgi:hypothetical protein
VRGAGNRRGRTTVALSRGNGEPSAADAARISGQSASVRGTLRMDAAPAGNWSEAANLASLSSNSILTVAERQQFAARGGVAAAIATAVSAKSSTSFDQEEALDVSEDAILALFGQNRAAVLRMAGLPLQKECEKDWKMRCAQAKEYEKQGKKVPSGFITPQWFFTLQYNRNLLFAAAPLKIHDISRAMGMDVCALGDRGHHVRFRGFPALLLDLTEPAAASLRFWADSAGRYAGDGHRTAGVSVDRSGSGSTWRGAPQQERRLLAWMGIGDSGGTRGVKES